MLTDVTTSNEALIRAQIESWIQAVRSRDAAGMTAGFAQDALLFDVLDPLSYRGLNNVRTRAQQWVSSFRDPLNYEVSDLQISAGEDVAFCHSLNHVRGLTQDGREIDMWWRATICFVRDGERWVVKHEHHSVPFNPQTGKASIDLKP
jgi:ketosteroid isomerase-like protein